MDTQSDALSRRPTRVKDGPRTMFDGELVNAELLRTKYLDGIPEAALEKLIRQGMPVVRLPNSARNWFRPASCLEWFSKFERQMNQPRSSRRTKA